MNFISWNVNGLESCIRKGFKKFFKEQKADFFCIQEIKCNEKIFNPKGYECFYNFSKVRGYSGTAIFTKNVPISEIFDDEGRYIILEYENFYIVNVYVPNSKSGIIKQDERIEWENKFLKDIGNLFKPLILCGDLNSTYLEIDRENPKINFSDENKDFLCKLMKEFDLKDSFRLLYPSKKSYTWKSTKNKNSGSRIDYFLISDYIVKNLREAKIYSNVEESDHFPIYIELNE